MLDVSSIRLVRKPVPLNYLIQGYVDSKKDMNAKAKELDGPKQAKDASSTKQTCNANITQAKGSK